MKRFKTFLLLGMLVCACGMVQADLMHRYDFAGDPNDRVGTADLLLGGSASISGGELDLPGLDTTRVNNAYAPSASLTELGATINGTDVLTMEFWFNVDVLTGWSKLFMAGTTYNMYMATTPYRGNLNYDTSCSLRVGGSDYRAQTGSSITAGTNYYLAALRDETTDTITIVLAEEGNPSSMIVSSGSMGGYDMGALPINEFYLGSAVYWGDKDLDGQVKEFRIYNELLDLKTITQNIVSGTENTSAVLVSPAEGVTQVDLNENLKWQASAISDRPIVNYDVYLGTDETAVTNATKSDAEYEATVSVVGGTEEYDPGTMVVNTDYYWRVDQVIDDGVTDPNTIKGAVWHFDTKTVAYFTDQPSDAVVIEGNDASFSTTVESATPTIFAWYKDGETTPLVDDDVNYDIVSGPLTSTLTVLNADIDDETSYYCDATNAAGTISSNTAALDLLALVAHYTLDTAVTPADANVIDSSGYENDGLAYNEPALDTGIIGAGAFVFDGNDYVIIPATVQDDFTISAWVKTTQTVDPDPIRWYKGGGIVNGEMPGGTYDFGMQLLTSKACIAVQNDYWLSETDINDGVWHHVVFTRENSTGTVKLYVDGETEVTDTGITGSLSVPTGLAIGKQYTGDGYFIGSIDDVRLYEYVMEPLAIAQMFVGGKPGETACVQLPELDLNEDCFVNLADLAEFAKNWLECYEYPTCYQ